MLPSQQRLLTRQRLHLIASSTLYYLLLLCLLLIAYISVFDTLPVLRSISAAILAAHLNGTGNEFR